MKIIPLINKLTKKLLLFLNKIKLPEWLIYSILYILLSISIKKYTGLSIFDILFNNWFMLCLVCFSFFINIIITTYYISSLYFILMFTLNKLSIPENLPGFLKNRLRDLYSISQYKDADREIFIKLYTKLAIFSSFIFIITIILNFIVLYLM
jgi:hypothetical protein